MNTQRGNRNISQRLSNLALLCCAGMALTCVQASADEDKHDKAVTVEVFAPANGDHAGIGGRGWFVDLAINYDAPLANTGFTGFQLTGPAGHNNVAPMPGTFSVGADDRLPGLVVLLSTAVAGSCQNVANLFNLTGVSNTTADSTELWDSWIIGAPNFGVNTASTLYVAVADDLNGDGIYNDAPNVVADSNGDGVCDKKDLKAMGVASNIKKVEFFINQ